MSAVATKASLHSTRGSRERMGLGARARTESVVRLPKRELAAGRVHLHVLQDIDRQRPRTRGDCANVPRPCPYVTCKWSLYLDVNEDSGAIKYNFPDRDPAEMPPDFSCALDVADAGGATLDDLGHIANVTRTRIQQIEDKALAFLKSGARGKRLRELADVPDGVEQKPIRQSGQGSVRGAQERGADREETAEVDDAPPTRVSFFANVDVDVDGIEAVERTDAQVCDRVWTMFAKDSNARGFDARTPAQRKAAAAKAKNALREHYGLPTKREETTMDKEIELTDRQKAILTAYRDLMKETGKPPSNLAIANRARVDGSNDNARAANVSGVIRTLRQRGLVGAPNRGPGANADSASKPARANGTKNAPPPRRAKNGLEDLRPLAKPLRETSSDPFINDLIAKRDEFRRKADALNVAIEAMSVAL